MNEGQERPLAATPAAISALLDWWQLAGVDTAVQAEPQTWLAHQASAPPIPPAPPSLPEARARPRAPQVSSPAGEAMVRDDRDFTKAGSIEDLRAMLRQGAPFADGNAQSGLLILGEAPSAEDLRSGKPFTGPAGQLLDRMLSAISLDRSNCCISLLCPEKRVPGPPSPEEVQSAMPLMQAQLKLLAPRFILLLGQNPVQALTGASEPISRLRGQWLDAMGVPALATFNPAYLLRRPVEKANAWADLIAFRKRLLN